MKQTARQIAGTAGLISCCFMLAACDPQSTFPIGPQSGAAEPETQERAAKDSRKSAEPRTVAATPAPAVRADVGEVIAVEPIVAEGEASGVGAAVGGVVGGLLGNQIGSGSGRAAATAAGAIAGGMVGNNAERNASSAPWYELYIRMDDGRRIVVSQRDLNGVREGAYIHISNGRAYLR